MNQMIQVMMVQHHKIVLVFGLVVDGMILIVIQLQNIILHVIILHYHLQIYLLLLQQEHLQLFQQLRQQIVQLFLLNN